jgi:hypothetical protein
LGMHHRLCHRLARVVEAGPARLKGPSNVVDGCLAAWRRSTDSLALLTAYLEGPRGSLSWRPCSHSLFSRVHVAQFVKERVWAALRPAG